MKPFAALLARVGDIRRGEGAIVARSAAALFLMIGAHTALETVRDTLILSRFPARDLALVYVAVPIAIIPVASLVSHALVRFGLARTLATGLIVSAAIFNVLFLAPVATPSVLALYVATSLVPAVIVPLFWNLLASVLSVAQGRRLLGTIAGAGGLGAATGSILAAGAVRVAPVRGLLVASAAVLVAAVFVLPPEPAAARRPSASEEGERRAPPPAMGRDPFARRIALLVGLSTAAFVVLDYSFKWTLVRTVSPDHMAHFVARYYAVLNATALVVQLTMGRTLLRRYSLATTVLVTPLAFVGAALAAVATGAAGAVVVAFKALDGVLRTSVYRVTTELLYLPLPLDERVRVKPFIDGAIGRAVQGGVGAVLFVLALDHPPSAMLLSVVLALLSAAWLVAAWSMRRPYVSLLRRSVAGDAMPWTAADPLDLESAETLVEFLSHEDPALVLGAMNALARRGRLRLVPGLLLLHSDTGVLLRALALFGASSRTDWFSLARKLLTDEREPVRLAAARALVLHDAIEPGDLAEDTSAEARAYAALHSAMRRAGDPMDDPVIAAILGRSDAIGEAGRLGLLIATADSRPSPRLSRVLEALARLPDGSNAWRTELARAASAQGATALIPSLVAMLAHRDGRDAVRTALASFGDAAVEALGNVLRDPSTPMPVRLHIPNTLARFGSARAAGVLLDTIEGDAHGMVRYKALRALGRIASERRVKIDRPRVERLALDNLLEYFRLLRLRAPLDVSPLHVKTGVAGRDRPERLLVGLLDDKLRQSLERTFRLLKIAYPQEDVHRIHDAFLTEDKHLRANAGELLDVLLRRRRSRRLQALMSILAEELSVSDVLERADAVLGLGRPLTTEEALAQLESDSDPILAALAKLHAAATVDRTARAAVEEGAVGPLELALVGA